MLKENIDSEIDLYLLRSEIYLLLKSVEETFDVLYSIPPDYGEQILVYFEILKDTSTDLINFSIDNDTRFPNRVVKFKISSNRIDKKIIIHFQYWVLIKNRKFDNLPKYVEITNPKNLSENTNKWLTSTESVQSNNIFIKIKAKLLKGFSKNLIIIAKRIIYYSSIHRPFLQLLRLFLEINPILRPLFLRRQYYTGLMDAISFFFIGGLCAAQTNFATALLRSLGIPTRILIVTAFGNIYSIGEKKWLDSQHYLFEFYCPGYGWIKSTPGILGYPTKNYIISRIIYPEDEEIAGNGLSYYGGMAPWFWIKNNNVSLMFPEKFIKFYKKPFGKVSGVPAIRLWTEKKISIGYIDYKKIFISTHKAVESFVKCSQFNLKKTKMNFKYEDAKKIHKKSIKFLKSLHINKFIESIEDSNKKYIEILTSSEK